MTSAAASFPFVRAPRRAPRAPLRFTVARDDLQAAILLFVIPLTQFLQVELVGQLLGSDVLVLLILPFLLFTRGLAFGRETRILLALLLVWLFGAVASDLYRGSSFGDLSRGWFRIVTFGAYVYVLSVLLAGRIDRAAFWALGYGLGALVRFSLTPGDMYLENPFKFGGGMASYQIILVVLPVLVPLVSRSILLNAALVLALGVYALMSDTRSLFGLLVAVSILTSANIWFRRAGPRLAVPPRVAILAILAGCILALSAATAVYENLAASGALGRDMQEKYLAQTSGDAGLLQSGRTESLVSLEAVKASPIIGHGSWARDAYYVTLKLLRMEQAGITVIGDPFEDDLIPTHSVLINAWVESGILAVPFWAAAIVFLGRFLLHFLEIRTRFIALFGTLLLAMMWDIVFSPMSTSLRVSGPIAICVACAALETLRARRLAERSRPADPARAARRLAPVRPGSRLGYRPA